MKIVIPTQDLLKNRPLEPNWYKAEYVKFFVKPTNDKQSTNFYAVFRLEIDEREMETMIANSKAMGMMEKCATVITGKEPEIDPTTGNPKPLEWDPEEFYGKKLQVKVVNEPFDGRLISKIKDYLPYDADVTVPFAV